MPTGPDHDTARSTAHASHAPGIRAPGPKYPDVIAIKTGDRFRFVSVMDIDYVEADGNHARLFIQKTPRVLHKSLREIAERVLDPAQFIRIHRSTIVNVSRIAFAEPLFHGELSVSLEDGTKLTCSRGFRSRLQERVHFVS